MSTDYNDVSVGVIYTNKSIILAERIDSKGRGGRGDICCAEAE